MIAVLLVLTVIVETMMVGALIMYVREMRQTMGQFGRDLESMRLYLEDEGLTSDARREPTDGND